MSPRRTSPVAAVRSWTAVRAGLATSWLSRTLGVGSGSMIGGRVTLALDPHALSRLAAGRRIVLVTGTNGKTTTSHLLAAALGTEGPVAHNASGSNMTDGAVAALAERPDASTAVIEVDELHLPSVAESVRPAAIVLLNLSRDQLDRGNEVRVVAGAVRDALGHHPDATVVANADDPLIVWAAESAARPLWVSAGCGWSQDTATCPACGRVLELTLPRWNCACGLARPEATWRASGGVARHGEVVVPLDLRIPGRFNLGNATMALAAASALGVDPDAGARAMTGVDTVMGRYAVVSHGEHELRLLLAKNPAGWLETVSLLDEVRSLLVVVNAREADGRDTSWLWDVPFERLTPRPVIASGEHAADLGVRLAYAGIDHDTEPDPLAALATLPPGKVDVVANYTAFHDLRRRLDPEEARR